MHARIGRRTWECPVTRVWEEFLQDVCCALAIDRGLSEDILEIGSLVRVLPQRQMSISSKEEECGKEVFGMPFDFKGLDDLRDQTSI